MFSQLVCRMVAAATAFIVLVNVAVAESAHLALVIGNAAYVEGPLRSALNDAGLVAEALSSAGYEVFTGADLDLSELRTAFRAFVTKVEAAGPEAEAFVYFSGYGLEFEGENYLLPIDVHLKQVGDVPIKAARLADLVRPLSGTGAATKIVVVDASRALPFPLEGEALAPGLAAINAGPRLLLAMSRAPGVAAKDGSGPYGPYARAIAEMVREPAHDFDLAFRRIRKRTFVMTDGKQIPWHVSALIADTAEGSKPGAFSTQVPDPYLVKSDSETAFAAAVEADSLQGYVSYAHTYPSSPNALQVWSIIQTRRESLTWLAVAELNSPDAYSTYLESYPTGAHAGLAKRRLQRMSANTSPPPHFSPVDFPEIGLPLPEEALASGNQLGPPSFSASAFIEPPPPFLADLAPPSPSSGHGELPKPKPLPLISSVSTRIPLHLILGSRSATPVIAGHPAVIMESTPSQQNSAPKAPTRSLSDIALQNGLTIMQPDPPPRQSGIQSRAEPTAAVADPPPPEETVPIPRPRPHTAVVSPSRGSARQAPIAPPPGPSLNFSPFR